MLSIHARARARQTARYLHPGSIKSMSAQCAVRAEIASRREWAGLGVVALPCLLFSMDLNVLHLAIPDITANLRPTASQLLWIVDIYGFMLAGFLVTMGALGDRIGRRRLLMLGGCAFAAASTMAACSRSAEMLIFSRAILGVAGATLAPSTLSLICVMFRDSRQRVMAISIWGSCFAAGGLLGPVVGGVLLEYFWWGSAFLLAVPLMTLLVVTAPLLLPEARSPTRKPLNLISAMLATSAVLIIVYAAKHTAEQGPDAWSVVFIGAGSIAGLLFVRRQKLTVDPLIDLHLFRDTAFVAALGANVIGMLAVSGSYLFVPQYLQLVAGMSPLQAGMWLAPLGLVHLASATLTPALSSRFEARTILVAGFLLLTLGHCLLSQVNTTSAEWLAIVALSLLLSGLVPILTITTNIVISAVPPDRAGTASGISETSAELGAALGIAVIGSIGASVYHARIGTADLAGIGMDVVAAAENTPGAAVAIALQLQGVAGEHLLKAARGAFMMSMQAAAAACTALSIAGATICAVFMRSNSMDTRRTLK